MPPSLLTFGSMSLGSNLALLDEHIKIARTAMDARVWFHSSPTYHRGFSYMVLRMAFDEAPSLRPPMIIKIRCGSARLLQFEVEDALRRLNLPRIDVAQLVFTETGPAPLVQDFTHAGPIFETCQRLRQQGKVAAFCPQCDAASSAALLPLATKNAFDGFVLYLNPLERDASEPLWQFLQSANTPLYALRTLAGALGHPARLYQRQKENPADPLLPRAEKAIALAKQLSIPDWPTLSFRFARSIPNLRTTIAGTANPAHLTELLTTAQSPLLPLPEPALTQLLQSAAPPAP